MTDRIVLVAEDEESVRNLISRILKGGGYQASLHPNGLLMVERYFESPDDIGLVITDILMPEIDGVRDGFAAIKSLREHNYSGNIICMSGTRTQEEIIGAGANYFIQKPFKIADFSALVENAYR